jgi:glycerophosphoryl diester phosphodiesterase
VVGLSSRWDRGSHPVLLGHRGARHAAPENTFAAFNLALREGARGVELDVRLNGSGEVMVCHDRSLERVTEGRDKRRLSELSSAQCAAVKLAGDERLPRLADVLDWAEQRNACVNVELKADDRDSVRLVQAVAKLLGPRAQLQNLLVSCFNAAALLGHRLLAPQVPSAWLVESAQLVDWPGIASLGSIAIHPKASLVTPERLTRWKRAGRRVHVWTVNDPNRALELGAWGVDALISDHPAALLGAFVARVEAARAQAGGS